jgi:hypothetical protein
MIEKHLPFRTSLHNIPNCCQQNVVVTATPTTHCSGGNASYVIAVDVVVVPSERNHRHCNCHSPNTNKQAATEELGDFPWPEGVPFILLLLLPPTTINETAAARAARVRRPLRVPETPPDAATTEEVRGQTRLEHKQLGYERYTKHFQLPWLQKIFKIFVTKEKA